MRLLLVEDDVMLGEALEEALMTQHYVIDWSKTGEEAIQYIKAESYDVVILDLGLPTMSGYDVLKHVRQLGIKVPIMILTARDAISDRVQGLDAGADDYLLKPFDVDELFARLRALTRRAVGRAVTIIEYGDLWVDPESQEVKYKQQTITLSRREFMLLLKFLDNLGRVLTREQLEQSLYGWGDDVESNTIEVHIHHLRKKISSSLINTVRGVGYLMPKNENTP